MGELALENYKLIYFKEYRDDVTDSSDFEVISPSVAITTQCTFLDYTAINIPTIACKEKFNTGLLVDPGLMRDCCKTVLSLMGATTTCLIQYVQYTGITKVAQLIKRVQELSEDGNYVVMVVGY